MASNLSSNGGGGYEALKILNTGDHIYQPGDKVSGLKKEEIESLVLSEVIGKPGSFKKLQEEGAVLALGKKGDVLEIVKGLKEENMQLKLENKGLQEQLAKK